MQFQKLLLHQGKKFPGSPTKTSGPLIDQAGKFMGAWSALSATCHCDLSRDADYRTLTSHLVSVSLWFQGQIRAWLAQSKSYCEDNDKVPQPGTYAQDYTPTVVQGARELQALRSRPMIDQCNMRTRCPMFKIRKKLPLKVLKYSVFFSMDTLSISDGIFYLLFIVNHIIYVCVCVKYLQIVPSDFTYKT